MGGDLAVEIIARSADGDQQIDQIAVYPCGDGYGRGLRRRWVK